MASDLPARFGWASDLRTFASTPSTEVANALSAFIQNAGASQLRVWVQSIPWLQDESRIAVELEPGAEKYTAILEYELPMEFRRPDVIVLENGIVVVLELKDKAEPTQADIDQVAAYARDLRAYHRECHGRPVFPVLVPSRMKSNEAVVDGVRIVPASLLAKTLLEISRGPGGAPLSRESFLRADAYSPLPTLVRAARELFHRGGLTRIETARAATEPALNAITAIAHEAAKERKRKLVLLSGLPGSGKTLVGLQLVHSHFLDDLAVARNGQKPTSPAIFLSGNGPLVSVLTDALKGAGGGGKTFVAGVKQYVKQYSGTGVAPPHHLLVFDEAQRAWDAAQVDKKHGKDGNVRGLSEPELFIEFAERVPDWCVVVGLIGTGQEIHVGEEGGVGQWRKAIERSARRADWSVHLPPQLSRPFEGAEMSLSFERALNLDTELRYHATNELHAFVQRMLDSGSAEECRALAERINDDGCRLFVSRDLHRAKEYLASRYSDAPEARYGIVGSSRDKLLAENGPKLPAVNMFDVARWYNAPAADPRSCCAFEIAASEFACQGLELDFALVSWGKDFIRKNGKWSIELSTRYQRTNAVKDPMQLRANAYRVLLTRGRDGFLAYLPPNPLLDETYEYLRRAGMRTL